MARMNRSSSGTGATTFEGAPAVVPRTTLAALRRSVCSCLLWEDEFYEDGQKIADRIVDLASKCDPQDVANLAIEAREQMNLRHVSLLLVRTLFGRKEVFKGARAAVSRVIQRADEMGELLAIYWGGKSSDTPVPRAMLRGIADAFRKFDEYQLAKYDRDDGIKLRDVLRLARPKPETQEQRELWGRVKNRELKTPDTWEVGLSTGGDKKETFERLLREGNLGYLALLRNLRKMTEVGVEDKLIRDSIRARKGARRVLPFRYIAAERHAPAYSTELDAALVASITEETKLPGLTVVVVDVSYSMHERLSGKSDMNRIDAASGLAAVIPAESLRVFSFSSYTKEVPARRGLAGVDAVKDSQPHQSTMLGQALRDVKAAVPKCDRLIVITDEQSHDSVGAGHAPAGRNYMINVASAQNGVGFGDWVRINGFSEGVIKFIRENEQIAERTVRDGPAADVAPDLVDA